MHTGIAFSKLHKTSLNGIRITLLSPNLMFTLLARRALPWTATVNTITAEQLHQRYLGDVFAYVSRRLPQRADAEDLTADVFVAAFSRLTRLRAGDDPRPWLIAIARNKLIDRARRQKVRSEVSATDALLETVASVGTPERTLLTQERRQQIWTLVDSLPADQREALLLQHLDDLSHAEIALVMGKSHASINSLLQRARTSLAARGTDLFLDVENTK